MVSIERFGSDSELGLWHLSESTEELFANLKLSDADLVRFSANKTDRRKKEWLACRNLLYAMTGSHHEISYDTYGKPLILNSKYHISMSHSGDYASVYLKKSGSCGVDIQKLKKSITAGADFFLDDEEMKWVDLQDNFQMHLIWSVKEAVFKYAGLYDIDFKKDITLKPFRSNQNEVIEVTIFNQGIVMEVSLRYLFFDEYVLAWTL